MAKQRTVIIDYIANGASPYQAGYAVVASDVIRATTTAITAAALGHPCFPVRSVEGAHELARELDRPLLAGEQGGLLPPGFHLNNSPAQIAARTDYNRPVILLSSSGTKLIYGSAGADLVHLACFRNAGSICGHLAGRHDRIALLGAATRGEFREEDRICCAWIARDLVACGYAPGNRATAELIDTWGGATAMDCLASNSVAYLQRSGQMDDLAFILEHVNDIEESFVFSGNQVVSSGLGVETPVAGAIGAR